MTGFNPFMSSPNQGQNQSYTDSYGNYSGYSQPNMSYDYPRDDWRNNAYGQPSGFQQAPMCYGSTAQDRFDQRMCRQGIVKHAGAGLAGGAVSGFGAGLKYCPKGPAFPPCVGATTTGGAAIGAWAGGHSALEGPSCQSITRTHVDQNGNGYTSYGSGR